MASTGWSATLQAVRLRAGHVLGGEHRVHAGQRRARRSMSIPRIRARGCGLRSVAPHSMSSAHRSEENANSPRHLERAVGPARARADAHRADDGRHRSRRVASVMPRLPMQRRGARARAPRGQRAVSSAVRSSPSSTTGRPPTSSSSSGARRAEHQRGDRVVDAGVAEPVEPPQREVGELARLERAELVVAAEAAGAADGAQRQRLAGGQRGRAAAQPGRRTAPGAAPRRAGRPPARRRRRRRARPGTPASSRSRTGAMPAPSRALERRAVRDAGAGRAEPRHRRVVEVHGVRQPHVVAEPAEPLGVLDRRAAVRVAAELLLVDGLGEVGVQPDALARGPARRPRSSASGVTENGEHGATATRSIESGDGSW